MNNVPLVKDIDKDSINTSIIAMKKATEELNGMLRATEAKVMYWKDLVDRVQEGLNSPVSSGAVASSVNEVKTLLGFKAERSIGSASTTSTYPNYYIKISGIKTNYTSATNVITFLVGTRYNRYILNINPWYTSGERLQVINLSGNDRLNIVDCAFELSSTTEEGIMTVWLKLLCNTNATRFTVIDISRNTDNDYVIEYLGNDNASYGGSTVSAYFSAITDKGNIRVLATNVEDSTPSFGCPRGGTYTLNFLKKQQVGAVAIYLGRVTIGSDASGGNMYIQVDGLRGSNQNICAGQWNIYGTSLSGIVYSAYGSGNTSLWLRIGNTGTTLQTGDCAGQSIDFSFIAIPYSA